MNNWFRYLTLKYFHEQAVEQNVIQYTSYAYVDVTVLVADQFGPSLSTKSGSRTGYVSEAAAIGDLIRTSTFTGTSSFLQVVITDNDYVSTHYSKIV
jgi:hypothetical protein